MLVGDLAQHPQALGVVDVHAAGALEHRLDDDPGQLVGVRRGERRATSSAQASTSPPGAGGWSAKTCCGSTSVNIECIPPTGSHTLMQPNVSPW